MGGGLLLHCLLVIFALIYCSFGDGVHLQFHADPSKMVVMWQSKTSLTNPTVWWGRGEGAVGSCCFNARLTSFQKKRQVSTDSGSDGGGFRTGARVYLHGYNGGSFAFK